MLTLHPPQSCGIKHHCQHGLLWAAQWAPLTWGCQRATSRASLPK
jgi:hypothetical protein